MSCVVMEEARGNWVDNVAWPADLTNAASDYLRTDAGA